MLRPQGKGRPHAPLAGSVLEGREELFLRAESENTSIGGKARAMRCTSAHDLWKDRPTLNRATPLQW